MKRVLIGLSGGVDSAVAAYLLKKEGHDVTGCFMRNWDSLLNDDQLGNPHVEDERCPAEVDHADAKAVAAVLGIELRRVDFIKEYWDDVFQHFLHEYERGRTPNPDIWCNKYIKFSSFLSYAREQGFPLIAMGHYAGKGLHHGHMMIKKGKDPDKDQSYFLAQLKEEQIRACLFPLADLHKKDVRAIARRLGLPVADKKGSTGICFIGERNFRPFLHNYLPARPGDIIDLASGRVIGRHEGVFAYTIGQHRGLGIGGIADLESQGWYVVKKDVRKNILYVVDGPRHPLLYSDRAIVEEINLLDPEQVFPFHVGVRFRYRQKDHPAVIDRLDDGRIEIRYASFKAVTPGQEAVFYDGDFLIGSGTIVEVYRDGQRIDI